MLAIEKLCFRYPTAASSALQEVSFTVRPGQVVGLLGPNGAGKTTLIAHLSGALPVQQGRILLDGKPLAATRQANPLQIAVAPQEYAFYPTLTVRENLQCFSSLGKLNRAERAARVQASLAFAQLEGHAHQRADRLSGGLKRRLNLAIALLHQPRVLLFDEPTVGVDPQSRAFILSAIKQLAESGCAVIYTSHYMEEVEAIADRVVIIDHGQILQQGTLPELLEADDALLEIGVEEDETGRLESVLSGYGETQLAGSRVRLKRDPQYPLSVVLAAVEASGLNLAYCHMGHANLEQLFMSLTHHSLRD